MTSALPPDVSVIFNAAIEALRRETKSVGGAWSKTPYAGTKYEAAEFELDGRRWVVCRGRQDGAYARLLDGTASLMAHGECPHGIAILLPPKGPLTHRLPSPEYRKLFRAAAWNGLGVLWCSPEDIAEWEMGAHRYASAELDEIEEQLTAKLHEAADATWADPSSTVAQQRVGRVVSAVLAPLGFVKAPSMEFDGFWRKPKTDGVWKRSDGSIRSLALEVKVKEDIDAPFGQLVDDLGEFDAVLQVRLVIDEETRRGLERPGLSTVRDSFLEHLPARIIHLRFCAICNGLVHHDGLAYPHLLCATCDERATSPSGQEENPAGDDGPNPVFIDGAKCWRRYRFGGWVAMHDPDDLPSLEAFYAKHEIR